MIETRLTNDLRDYLRERLAEVKLPTKAGGTRAPEILNGYLPPKRTKTGDDFPFVLVRADRGQTAPDATTVSVSIIVGVYSEDFDAHDICLSVMAKIRQALYDLPDGTLSERYQFRPGFSWENFPEQGWPYWQLDIKTEWLMPAPEIAPDPYTVLGSRGF